MLCYNKPDRSYDLSIRLSYTLGFLKSQKATKGVWWMPWGKEPMKDATSSDIPR